MKDTDKFKFSSNLALVLWVLVSIALWLLTPSQFTKTDGPAGVFTMIVVGIIAIPISMMLWGVFKRLNQR